MLNSLRDPGGFGCFTLQQATLEQHLRALPPSHPACPRDGDGEVSTMAWAALDALTFAGGLGPVGARGAVHATRARARGCASPLLTSGVSWHRVLPCCVAPVLSTPCTPRSLGPFCSLLRHDGGTAAQSRDCKCRALRPGGAAAGEDGVVFLCFGRRGSLSVLVPDACR